MAACSFAARLVHGEKPPYQRWAFLEVPSEVGAALGRCPPPVRGSIDGALFHSVIHRSSGQHRVVIRGEDLPDGIGVGALVSATLRRDEEPRPIEIPRELAAVFERRGRSSAVGGAASPPASSGTA